jgi:uncharacterized protein (TIGR00369 family)
MEGSPPSGVEYLRSLIGDWKRSPMGFLLGQRLIEVDEGTVLFEAFPKREHYNPGGIVHGGYAATLIDSALGCAVQTKLPAGTRYGTVELKVNYVRPLTEETGRVLCRGTCLHAGRKMQIAEARLEDGAGKLYALGSGTFMTFG